MLRLIVMVALCGFVSSSPQSRDVNQSHQCGDPRSYRCVPDFQCRGGEIIRDGDGQVDVRGSQGGTTPRPVICVNSRYPNVLSHCCHIPGTPVIQAPTDFCDGGRKCVRSSLCSADGTINKDGTGLIDKKSGQATCLINKKDIGVCCSPTVHKPPNFIDHCPDGGQCVAFEGCNGNSMNFHNVYKYHSDSSLLRPCKLRRRINGICCLKKRIPQIGQCGVSNPKVDTRIVSNTAFKDYEAGFAEFPWQAIIFSTGFSFVCGATLISDRFLLTAAHCVDDGVLPSSLSVRLGEWKVNGEEEELPFVDIDVAAITIHPEFNPINVHNGIAVLELVHPVTFDFHISTLCMPASRGLPSPSTRCIATGWGKNAFRTGAYQHILKKVELPLISHDECQNLLRRTRLGKFYTHHESFICAGGEENRDVCEGDGGGPLACYNEAIGKYELIGMTAWGVGCGVKDVPGVFINVPFFTDWINEVTGGDNCVQSQYPGASDRCRHVPDIPVEPVPVDVCDGDRECVPNIFCSADGTINTDRSGTIDIRSGQTSCRIYKKDIGVCCSPPVRPILDYCPGKSVCVNEFKCAGKALIESSSNTFIDYVNDGKWEDCKLAGGISAIGICCEPYPVLDTCPGKSQCVYQKKCLGNALDRSQAFKHYQSTGSWSECWLPDQAKGLCCEPPYVIDHCPDGGECVAAESCKGNVMDYNNVYNPYSKESLLMPCSLGTTHMGICCITSSTGQCGVSNPKYATRVLSSAPLKDYEAGFAEFPWQAIVFGEENTFVCGATLISDKFLLTAAHHVDGGILPSSLRVRLGEWQLNSFDEERSYVDIDVEAIIIHPEFTGIGNLNNDLAVLELVKPVAFDFHINTLCVPASRSLPNPSTRCIATGWGKDAFDIGNYQHILKKVSLPFVAHDACQGILINSGYNQYYRLHDSFVCAGGEVNKDVCEGDGGGPLACFNEDIGRYELIGITSWGLGCGQRNIPGVYVNVPYFSDWINKVTGVTSFSNIGKRPGH